VTKRSLISGIFLILMTAVVPAAAQEIEVVFCREVADREPVETGDSFPADVDWLYCHVTLANNGEPTQIHHDWYFEGTLIERITLSIGASPRWRTWSAKKMGPAWVGKWEVVIKTEGGRELTRASFTLQAAAPSPEPIPAAP